MITSYPLQGGMSTSGPSIAQGDRFQQLLPTMVDFRTRVLTANESPTSSVEGIECIMMEAMVHNHAGILHQALRAVRRATTAAQIVGLHCRQPLSHDRFLDPNTRAEYDPERLHFHIVCMDHYLSTTLGLSPASSHLLYARLAEEQAIFEPIGRMMRLQCNIAETLLQRTTTIHEETHKIDSLLLGAATVIPSSWWLTQYFPSSTDPQDTNTLVMRLNCQLSHCHLLVRLYLPYVLRVTTRDEQSHGKRVA